MPKTIVVQGNPVDGFKFYGPFVVGEDANDWAERELKHEEYWMADLEEVPDEDDG